MKAHLHRVERFSYKTGAVYSGQMFKDFRHGFGEITWRDGARYAG